MTVRKTSPPGEVTEMVTRLRTADGRITWMQRRDSGYPLALALARQGLSLPKLAAKTKEVDPDGRGVSFQIIGQLVTQGRSARETTTRRTAELVAAALSVPLSSVFEERVTGAVRTPRVSAQRRDEGNGVERSAA
jgi:hypothetical protein